MLWAPDRLAKSAWIEHVPFAFWLVDVLRPATIVELGTENGVSYSAMCQAVKSLELPTRCCAVDTWKGDQHAGFYLESVYHDFADFHDARYSTFSSLLRLTFDEAVEYFEDKSIDLLHIDGLHTYDAVRHDFETWLPKLSPNAVVVFHDTNVRQNKFGVFQLWAEVGSGRRHFSFLHGHGLGVLGLGRDYSGPLSFLFDAADDDRQCSAIRETFATLGRSAAQSNTMHQVLSESAVEVDRLKGQLTARDGLVAALDKVIARQTNDLDAIWSKLAERDATVVGLESNLSALKTSLAALKASTSWRVSAPVRAAKRLAVQFRYSPGVYTLRLGLRALRCRSLAPLRDWRATRAIARSGLFDREWYRNNNADVLQWGIDPVRHYIIRGARMGRDPSPSFSTLRYLAENPDIALTGLNPLAHVLRYGAREAPAAEPNQRSLAGPRPQIERGAVAEDAPEWSDYLPLRLRIAEEQAARIGAVATRPYDILDISPQDLPAIIENLSMPSCADPLVSIIVPVFNNVKLTAECLLSVAKHADNQVPFEVILADDASSDDTEALLPKVKNLVYLRNSENLGFLRNCNNAARSARGHYLLFLNNDVQVTQGWLSALVATLQKQRDVGAAGPKIVYPSGRLQEAGARLNRDGTSQLIGLTDDPSLPCFSYLREVDYCSGACLLVERTIFWEVGGFSDAFAPAYCEDADLCLKLRQRGLRTVYNPASVIVHHLSSSSEHADKMRRIAANQQKLSEHWQGELDQLNDVRVIAFYLPQFHAIAENDEWWGHGFTEWSNVVRARPNFTGHYQPRLPAELGYYDLRDPESMQAQAKLARSFGVHGFCYYYFWFGGKRLLEMPLERMLRTGQPDFPFCLCWANENWSRRWDGLDADVLMAQQHSDDDDAAVIHDVMRYFRSDRYIRIGGRPLVLVYRVDLFPDFAHTAMIWRDICRREGVGEIYLAMVASFDLAAKHPATYGCDAAVEFPPHGGALPAKRDALMVDPDFSGEIYDYREYVVSAVKKPIPPFTRFRSVMPSWDNTPRRQTHGHVFINSTPGTFQAWLEAVMQCTREQNAPDQRFVFINAWNEWGEGAYIEPDRRFGRSYLEAIRNAHEQWQFAMPRRDPDHSQGT